MRGPKLSLHDTLIRLHHIYFISYFYILLPINNCTDPSFGMNPGRQETGEKAEVLLFPTRVRKCEIFERIRLFDVTL